MLAYSGQGFEAWRLCAELQLKLKKPEGAFETLTEGRVHFGQNRTHAQAIALLTRAREIEAWDDDLLFALSDFSTNDSNR
ncbi:MAG: hypothetical protein GY910_15805 [bacterium]|nr:hypothetical protein [Deltaproteobacteria bacterium]MCP4906439.1 hypothetical protein [bacterium]